MRIAIDMAGQRFGRLLVRQRSGSDSQGRVIWDCVCDCGKAVQVRGSVLRAGQESCGCLAAERAAERGRSERGIKHLKEVRAVGTRRTHGQTKSTAYVSWVAMLQRCTNQRRSNWKWYGALGVQVCDRWRSFANFYADMGDRPGGTTLDRIDPEGDYSPENCRWASGEIQRANKRARK